MFYTIQTVFIDGLLVMIIQSVVLSLSLTCKDDDGHIVEPLKKDTPLDEQTVSSYRDIF